LDNNDCKWLLVGDSPLPRSNWGFDLLIRVGIAGIKQIGVKESFFRKY
jgi:hypothetical protein